MTENSNPLNKYFRQPAIYITLPAGNDYSPQVIEPTATGELPVMPMTAKDEIKFKTPDALMNGQGVVEVIQSCIPNIKDAWQIKSYDVDTILVAIRIATYGETMDINFNVPVINEQSSHTLNLPAILDQIKTQKINHIIKLKDGLTIETRPLTYKDLTSTSLQTFQQQKIYSTVQASEMSDEEKVKRFDQSFKALTELNSSVLLKNISRITTPEGVEVTDPDQIKEFIENVNTTIITELQDELTKIRLQGAVQPLQMKATEDQIKKGVPTTYQVPITFDTANFFV